MGGIGFVDRINPIENLNNLHQRYFMGYSIAAYSDWESSSLHKIPLHSISGLFWGSDYRLALADGKENLR